MESEESVRGDRLIDEAVARIRDRLASLRSETTDLPHPDRSRSPFDTVADDLIPKVPAPGARGETVAACAHLARRLVAIHGLTMGRLVARAEAVEGALGLEPLPPRVEATSADI